MDRPKISPPLRARLRLCRPLCVAGRMLPAGSVALFGVEVARHLVHLQRAAPADAFARELLRATCD